MLNQNDISSDKVVVYFDGVCGLCNRFVDFLLEKDRADRFRFSPLQSDRARKHLPAEYTGEELGTVVVEFKNKTYYKSRAVLIALSELNSFFGAQFLLRILATLPQFLLDWAYDFVARRRYAWFGREETCRLPSANEKYKFLD